MRSGRGGFTLAELLVSIAILTLIVLTVSQMLIGAQQAIAVSRRLLDCDDQARLAFGRMENDFTKIVKRTDVDFIFSKQNGASSTKGANDKIFFYSLTPGDNANAVASTTQVVSYYYTSATSRQENPVSLVGYFIAADPNIPAANNPPVDLQRLGRGLNWMTKSNATTVYDNMVYLTALPTSTTYFDPLTTLDGHWGATAGITPNVIGTPADSPSPYTGGDTANYHVIGDQIFRFEYCFLLKDGSYSDYPVEANSTNVPALSAPCIVATRPPKTTDDNANTGGAGGNTATGTRWFDTNAGRAYICTNPAANAAVWQGQGVQDVAAIVVSIALLDRNTRTLLNNAGGTTAELASLLGDSGLAPASPGVITAYTYTAANANTVPLMQKNWQSTLNSSTFPASVATATGASAPLAAQIASRIRIYQRYFYLNTAASL